MKTKEEIAKRERKALDKTRDIVNRYPDIKRKEIIKKLVEIFPKRYYIGFINSLFDRIQNERK